MAQAEAAGRAEPDLEQEFAILMCRAGLSVPADRLDDMLVGYKDIRGRLEILRQPRTVSAEPSNTYALSPLVLTP